MADSTIGRLPMNVRPIHYNLTLEPDLEKFDFQGKVEVWVNILDTTDSITLHIGDLFVQNVHICGDEIPVENFSINKDKEMMTIHMQNPISAGETVTLSIGFNGVLNDNLSGFYRSSYKDENDQIHYLAVTQMQPTDARQVFPCFDEPALKATFAITLIAAQKLVCLSNMDVKSEEAMQNGKKKVVFNTSPPMSTYIVGIIVGDLAVIQTDVYRIPIRLYAVAGTDIERLGKFALDLTARTLSFYDEQFDFPFPLPKMDMIAVPDFVGALENWGLVMYRERDILVEASGTPIESLQRVVRLVLHELAHQWFGNLVTMNFWDDLWLNEGFATWMAWYACNAFYPEWNVWQTYTCEDLQRGLALDGMRSSHPVLVPIKSDDDIGQIFDDICYAKGACVLRMIASAVGQEPFLQGIRVYIRKHRYGNAKTEDLWSVLSNVSGQRVGEMMHPWTQKAGFPMLFVTENYDSSTIHIRQTRFLMTESSQPRNSETIYPLSLGLRTTTGVNMDVTLTTREGEFHMANLDFFKINANHTGFYRTAYSPERLEKLGEAAVQGLLPVEDCVGLIADASALAAAGFQRTSDVLSLLAMMSKKSDYVIWSQILISISDIGAAWMYLPETQKALQAFERQLIGKAHKLHSIVDQSDDCASQRLKSLLFGRMAFLGDQECQRQAFEMFTRYCGGDRSAIHPDIRTAVFAAVLHTGSEADYNAVLDLYRTTNDGMERITALTTLGYARNPALIQRTIAMLLSDEMRLQDIQAPMTSLGSHPNGITALWHWFMENWPIVKERLSSGLVILPRVISLCTKGLATEEQLHQAESFFEELDSKGTDKAVRQSLDDIRIKRWWVERDAEDMYQWLQEYLEHIG
ncbi:hypothetical protein N7451_010618 [Penicillium sp. IBT 35674x]|nr:hypothetical protein N7451_010618 [Penicillium sp. IBT 35674x]